MKLKAVSGSPISETAYSRHDFKNRSEEKLRGAILEYCKAETAAAHGLTRWVERWRSEALRLLDELEKVILPHRIRGFRDRKKALMEVLEDVRRHDEFYRESARRIVARDFSLKKLPEGVPPEVCQAFFEQVQDLEV